MGSEVNGKLGHGNSKCRNLAVQRKDEEKQLEDGFWLRGDFF